MSDQPCRETPQSLEYPQWDKTLGPFPNRLDFSSQLSRQFSAGSLPQYSAHPLDSPLSHHQTCLFSWNLGGTLNTACYNTEEAKTEDQDSELGAKIKRTGLEKLQWFPEIQTLTVQSGPRTIPKDSGTHYNDWSKTHSHCWSHLKEEMGSTNTRIHTTT